VDDEVDVYLGDPKKRGLLMSFLDTIASEPSMFGASAHLLSITRKQR